MSVLCSTVNYYHMSTGLSLFPFLLVYFSDKKTKIISLARIGVLGVD